MNKLKTKFKNVAQSKPESLSLSTALLAIHEPLPASVKNPKLNQNTNEK